jgi:O-antigen ligase
MGFILTLIMIGMMSVLTFVSRRAALNTLLYLFVFFTEMGWDFSSFHGSFVFNQRFTGFFNFRFIEFAAVAVWFVLLLSRDRKAVHVPMRDESRWAWLFLGLVTLLCLLEYGLHQSLNVGDWRLIVSGMLLMQIFVLTIDSPEGYRKFVRLLLWYLAVRALIGLAMYFAGYGVPSPRGMTPFFWDSKQVDAFALGIVLLTGYLAFYGALKPEHRILGKGLAWLMLVVLVLTVFLSLRRTVWVVSLLGVVMVLVSTRRLKIHHLLGMGVGAGVAIAIAVAVVTAIPQLEEFEKRMTEHVTSINIFSEDFSKKMENEVHIDNVEKYTRIILDNPEILGAGYRAYPGVMYEHIPELYSEKYPLGVAHNGVLRTVFFFGIVGLIIYLGLIVQILLLWRGIRRMPDDSLFKPVAMAAYFTLLIEFAAAFFWVPPFYTSSKGLFYVFMAIFLVRGALHFCAEQPAAQAVERKPVRPGLFPVGRRAVAANRF